MLGSFAATVTSVFTLSTIAYEDLETIDGYAAVLTARCRGVPAQDGFGNVRSYELNLPKF